MVVPNLPALVWPFSAASYIALCPEGHVVEMATGNCVHAPDEWTQFGKCSVCNCNLTRQVGMVDMDFVAGPTHWEGMDSAKEAIWRHDVLLRHKCARCQDVGALAIARLVLNNIEGGADLDDLKKFVTEILNQKVG